MTREKLVVTGANGFVGRHLVDYLLQQELHLTLIAREARSLPVGWRGNDRITVVETGALETASNLDKALEGATTVLHLAGLAHVRSTPASAQLFETSNAVATKRLADAAAQAGVRSFVHLSSMATILGGAASDRIVDDATDEQPYSEYGRTKRMAEEHVSRLSEKGILAISLRPPLVIGPDAKGNWKSLQWLAATGLPLPFASVRNRRSLIDIGTLVRALHHLAAREWPVSKSGNYCIAGGRCLTLPEIVTLLRKGMAMQSRLFPFPPSFLRAAARLLNRRQQADALLGNLEIDDRRFREAFSFNDTQLLDDAIVESAMQFILSRSSPTTARAG